MKISECEIAGLLVLEPQVYKDERGYFIEAYRESQLLDRGLHYQFIQDNQSRSSQGVIRGLHFQKPPHAQAKLIRVIEGAIYDVAVDLRRGSPTYGQWFGLELNEENHRQMLIPRGFAHGFSVLSPRTTVLYKCDAYYERNSQGGIRFDDPDLAIDWKIASDQAIISPKDQELPFLKNVTLEL